MRCLPALILVGIAATPVAAAQSSTTVEPVRTWVFFRDRAGAAPAPAAPEAQRRRALRAAADPDSLDFDVSPRYVRALEAGGFTVEATSRWLNAAVVTTAAPERLAALPFVRGTRPLARLRPTRSGQTFALPEPAGPLDTPVAPAPEAAPFAVDCGPACAQLTTINALAPLERGVNGTGVTMGILDTEYGDFLHPAFDALRSSGRLKGQRLFTPGPQANRHGQNCASILLGYAPGQLVGPGHGASLYAAVTEYAPSETNAEEDAFVAGLEWLEQSGVDVVSVSLGYNTFDAGQRSYTTADLTGDTAPTTRAADAAVARGVSLVVAAGNDGCASPASCWYYITTPADGDSVLAVGAVNASGVRAGFSGAGPTADGRTKPDVAAMGVSNRYATGASGYATGSGTSFATPLVAGVVAQMLQANPALSPMQVRAILRATSSQASAPDNLLGWGIVNADAAVQRAAQLVSTTPEDVSGGPTARAAQSPLTGQTVLYVQGSGRTRAALYDVLGRRVADLFDGDPDGLERRLPLPALAPGLYVYRVDDTRGRASGTVVVR